jgi:hypothetical protein
MRLPCCLHVPVSPFIIAWQLRKHVPTSINIYWTENLKGSDDGV